MTSRLRQRDKHQKHLSHTTCTTKFQLVKCKENKLIKAKQDTYTCYVKIKWPIFDYKSKMWNTKHKNLFGFKKLYDQKQDKKTHITLNE